MSVGLLAFVPSTVLAFTQCCCKYTTPAGGTPQIDTCDIVQLNALNPLGNECENVKGSGWADADPDKCAIPVVGSGSPVQFTPNVALPNPGGIVFSRESPVTIGVVEDQVTGQKYISGSLLGNYIINIFRLLVYLAAFLSMFMIIWGGFKWLWGAGSEELIGSAKKTIINAVMGLLLALSGYLILMIINPNLVNQGSFKVDYIEPRELEEGEEDGANSPLAVQSQNLVTPSGLPNIVALGGVRLPDNPQLLQSLREAGASIQGGYQMTITSGFRTPAHQQAIINRFVHAGKCNPAPPQRSRDCRPPVCVGGPNSCPHTSGRAIDAWGTDSGGQCISQENCIQDLAACRENDCQKAIGQALEANGFCNIASEPWHFEYTGDGHPAVSRGCTSRFN